MGSRFALSALETLVGTTNPRQRRDLQATEKHLKKTPKNVSRNEIRFLVEVPVGEFPGTERIPFQPPEWMR